MTAQEAIKELTIDIIPGATDHNEAVRMAISALEKQISRKVAICKVQVDAYESYVDVPLCPNCGKLCRTKICQNCGQVIMMEGEA